MEKQNNNSSSKKQEKPYFPISVPDNRYDQRNEMFKRRTWDEKFIPLSDQLYKQVKFQDRYGYRKLDYAFRNAAWNIEYGFGFGTMRSNWGLYSWTHIPDKAKRFVEAEGAVNNPPEVNVLYLVDSEMSKREK